MIRTNTLPRFSAVRAPMKPPNKLAGAISAATSHMTWPPGMKITSAAKLVEMFTNFANADALKKLSLSKLTKPKTRNIPVPGPIKPS